MKMNFGNRSRPVTLQLLRTPDGVKAVFDDGRDVPGFDEFAGERSLSDGIVSETPDESPAGADHFLTLRELAVDLYDLIELEGVRLGWTVSQIRAFQAPVERIRDAAQAVLDRRRV